MGKHTSLVFPSLKSIIYFSTVSIPSQMAAKGKNNTLLVGSEIDLSSICYNETDKMTLPNIVYIQIYQGYKFKHIENRGYIIMALYLYSITSQSQSWSQPQHDHSCVHGSGSIHLLDTYIQEIISCPKMLQHMRCLALSA